MNNLLKEYTIFFRGIHPASLYLVLGALRIGVPSSQIEIYVTIVLGMSVLENYTWHLPMNDSQEMG